MLISSYVTRPDVYARLTPDGRHIIVDLERARGVSMTLSAAEAAALRDALTEALDALTEALLSLPEGHR